MELANVLMLFEDKSPAKKKADIVKLHRQFGHSSTNNLKKLLRNANLLNKELENLIDIVVKECEVCCRRRKRLLLNQLSVYQNLPVSMTVSQWIFMSWHPTHGTCI